MDTIALSPKMQKQIAQARAETMRYIWRQFLSLFARRA